MTKRFVALTAALLLGTASAGTALAQATDMGVGTSTDLTSPGNTGTLPRDTMPPPALPSDPVTGPSTVSPSQTLSTTTDPGRDHRTGGVMTGSALDGTNAGIDAAASARADNAQIMDGTDGDSTGASLDNSEVTGTGTGPGVLAQIDTDSISGSSRQKEAEVSRQLLNRFNSLGFADFREFTRTDQGYRTQAQTTEGEWVTVMIDPQQGTITRQ